MTRFSVVVCTLRRLDELRRTLAAVAACEPPPYEVIVVDGDEHRSAEPAAAGVRYVASPPGLTRQRNRGVAEASGDVVVFFDDDARPALDVFAHLARAYEDSTVVGATGRVVEPGDHRRGGRGSVLRRVSTGWGRPGTFTIGGYPRRFPPGPGEMDVEFMQGAFLSARRHLAADVGFDEGLPGYGLAEDEDFSRRLSRHGRIRYLGDAVVEHDNSGFGTRDRRAFGRQVVANRSRLFRRNFPQTWPARAMFAYHLAVLLAHRLANGDLAGFIGLVEGIRALRIPTSGAVTFVSSHSGDGGSERYLERLLAELGPQWVRSIIALEEGPMVARLRAAGHSVEVVVAGRRAGMAVGAWRLRRHLRRAGGGLVHANGVKAAVLAVLAGARPLWVKHDMSLDGRVAILVARRCREVIGVSRAVLGVFDGTKVPTVVVPTGVAVREPDRTAARAEVASLAGGEPVVTAVGRFHPVKGLLDAVAATPPAARLLLVGDDDPATPEHGRQVRATTRAVIVSHVDDMAAVLAGSDVVVVPSRSEGFGLVALEAMAVGTPVVAYAVGAVPEVVGDAGVLVPAGDVAALGHALGTVLADADLRSRLGEAGRQRARTEFDVGRWAAGMQARYRTHGASAQGSPSDLRQ